MITDTENYTRKRNKYLSSLEIDEIVNLYSTGNSSLVLAKRFDVSISTILNKLVSRGIKIRDKNRIYEMDHDCFEDIENSEESQYWFGFLLADGCLSGLKYSNLVRLQLAKVDEDHVKKFKNFCKSEHPITDVINKPTELIKGYQKGTSFGFGSKKITDKLRELGMCCPGSLSRIVNNNIKYSPHLWRGVIDGDGSVGFANGVPYIELCGWAPLLNQFCDFIEYHYKDAFKRSKRLYSRGVNSKIYGVFKNGQIAYDLITFLYKDSSIYLDRKYAKAIEVMETNYTITGIYERLTATEITTIHDLYLEGKSKTFIAKQIGRSLHTILNYTESEGMNEELSRIRNIKIDGVVELYKSGLSAYEISKKYLVCPETIRKWLIKRNIRLHINPEQRKLLNSHIEVPNV